MSLCSKCKINPRAPSQRWCQSCRNEYNRKYYKRNPQKINEANRKWREVNETPEYIFKRNLKVRYGLTLEQYHKLLQAQENRCAICNQLFEDSKVCVDHNHTTGNVRGLLCTFCNVGLGYFREDSTIMNAAIKYINTYD